jgi:hypothetical protein
MPVLVPSSSSLIVFFFFAYSTVEYVDPRVLFSTLKWPFTYSKKRGFHFFPFIQVLNFWVPERTRLILHVNYCWRTQLWVHEASGFKGYVLDLKNIFFLCEFLNFFRGWNERAQRELSNKPIKSDFKKSGSPLFTAYTYVILRLTVVTQ